MQNMDNVEAITAYVDLPFKETDGKSAGNCSHRSPAKKEEPNAKEIAAPVQPCADYRYALQHAPSNYTGGISRGPR